MKKKKYKKIKRINNAMRVRTLSVSALIAILFICLMGRLVYFSVAKIRHMKKVLAQQNYQSQTLPYKKGRYPRQKRKHAGYQPEVIQSGPGTEKYPAYRADSEKCFECTDQIYGP